jgi:four helix bundle protein
LLSCRANPCDCILQSITIASEFDVTSGGPVAKNPVVRRFRRRTKEDKMTADEFSERLWDFAVGLAKLIEQLPDTRLGHHIAGQLIRCGTASAPNYDEGCAAESRKDFVHKLAVATKEMRETRGWLRYTFKLRLLSDPKLALAINESDQLLRMLTRSVHTAKMNNEQ